MKMSEKRFLEIFFANLEKRKIIYAVLRGAEKLPESLGGGDIDIQVKSEQLTDVLNILNDTVVMLGGRITGQMKSPHFVQTEMMGCLDGIWWGCCIDLFSGIWVNGVLPLCNDFLLDRRIDNGRGIWTLPFEEGQYLGYVKELFIGGRKSVRYIEGAKTLIARKRDDILVSERCRAFIRKILVHDSGSPKKFIFSWIIRMALRHPLFFLRNWLCFHWSRMSRYFSPCGKMIVVLGTDGAGKTTLLNAIMPLIQTATHNSSIVYHLRPGVLPPLSRLRGGNSNSVHICTTPHGAKASGFVGSLIRLTYLTCDYILGYWIKVRVRVGSTPIGHCIFDRYAYDILLDPLRFRINLPNWIIKSYLAFIPKPDLVLCLGGDPEKIYERKPETTLEEVVRQVSELKSFCSASRTAHIGRAYSGPSMCWVDTTIGMGKSCDMIVKAIVEV